MCPCYVPGTDPNPSCDTLDNMRSARMCPTSQRKKLRLRGDKELASVAAGGLQVAVQTRRNALRTHLSHQFTIFFAPLHFLYLDRLTKEILATCEHISFTACFEQLINYLKLMWLCQAVHRVGVRTHDLGFHCQEEAEGTQEGGVPDPSGYTFPFPQV